MDKEGLQVELVAAPSTTSHWWRWRLLGAGLPASGGHKGILRVYCNTVVYPGYTAGRHASEASGASGASKAAGGARELGDMGILVSQIPVLEERENVPQRIQPTHCRCE